MAEVSATPSSEASRRRRAQTLCRRHSHPGPVIGDKLKAEPKRKFLPVMFHGGDRFPQFLYMRAVVYCVPP